MYKEYAGESKIGTGAMTAAKNKVFIVIGNFYLVGVIKIWQRWGDEKIFGWWGKGFHSVTKVRESQEVC